MLLSPWQKWKKYNRVPWKVVLHALIFIVVTVQVLLAYVETSQYTRATHNTFESLFLATSDPDVTSVTMHTMEEVIESLKKTVNTVLTHPVVCVVCALP
jgi:ABC-type phosphate/phosphonate transport system permease subunit